MLEKLNADFEEILKLVKKCPAELQDIALKTLLENWFRLNTSAPGAPPATQQPPQHPAPQQPSQIAAAFRPFMVANSLTEAHLQKVYHPVGVGAQLVVSEIPGRGKASQEVSLALLLSVGQALGGEAFGCGLEELRQMCLHYNCYDSANFAATLTHNKTLFKPRKKGEDITLSGPGMKKAAELIKNIAPES